MKDRKAQVKWTSSLRFQMFVVMSFCLIATVVGISWQNSATFRNLLRQQSQDTMLTSATRSTQSMDSLFEMWASLLHFTMHGYESGSTVDFQKRVQELLRSNAELVAFHIVKVNRDCSLSETFFEPTEYLDSPRFAASKPKETMTMLRSNLIKDHSCVPSAVDKNPFISNLSKELSPGMLQVWFPFTSKSNSEATLWAGITVWDERIYSLLDKGKFTQSSIFLKNGDQLLRTSEGAVRPEKNQVHEFQEGPLPSLYLEKISDDGQQVGFAFSRTRYFDLTLVTMKDALAEHDKLDWRTRRLLLFAWLVLLLSLLVSYLVTGRLVRQIKDVVLIAIRISDGDLTARTTISNRSEIGILGQAINGMGDKLKSFLELQVDAARQEKELKTAQAVQKTLLPSTEFTINGLWTKGFYRSASECGGDWWGHVQLSEHHSLLVIADATGHGASAALIVAMTYSYFQRFKNIGVESAEKLSLPEVLNGLNLMLWETGKGESTMTVLCCMFDRTSETLRYVNGGHVHPFLFPASDSDLRLKKDSLTSAKSRIISLNNAGPFVGFSAQAEFAEKQVSIKKGDKVFLFTDGLVECEGTDKSVWTRRALTRSLSLFSKLSVEDFHSSFLSTVEIHFARCDLEDDVTFVTVGVLDER